MGEPVRFVDVLTTASAVAHYRGHGTVTAAHLADALSIVLGEKSMEDLGRPASPMLRHGETGVDVSPAVRELAMHWFDALGNDPAATLDEGQVEELRRELHSLQEAP
ncbi:MAG: hypothetical protein Kow0010_10370 [Dehalococcoidia bacterium]